MFGWLQNLLLIVLISISLLVKCREVKIFHLIDNEKWGEVDGTAIQGRFACFEGVHSCEVVSSDCRTDLKGCIASKRRKVDSSSSNLLVASLYHIHTWNTMSKTPHGPDHCSIPAHYSIAESEESHGRFNRLFSSSFPHFDGNSTTSPFSSIQRTYFSGFNVSEFLPMKPFNKLISGASFVASTCHRGEGVTKRLSVVARLQKYLRVDSLGRCHTTKQIPEGIVLTMGRTAQESLALKQSAISNYLFYCAFENTYEPGYVTEKVFDALIAGVVPVYLGPSHDCRPLLPSPHAAIFLDDFNHNITALAAYLTYLSHNETAYEMHRSWRQGFNPAAHASPLLTKSWPCRICEWAVRRAESDTHFEERNTRVVEYMANSNRTC